jgi:hypothetical protein
VIPVHESSFRLRRWRGGSSALKRSWVAADGISMDVVGTVPYRRMGTILVDRQLISDDQLAYALVGQEKTGRRLGEICVEQYGLDRLALADAIGEQWEEMQCALAGSERMGGVDGAEAPGEGGVVSAARSEVDELRALLDEAEAARADLVSKTDELGRRLAVLETLVIGVSGALAELRP